MRSLIDQTLEDQCEWVPESTHNLYLDASVTLLLAVLAVVGMVLLNCKLTLSHRTKCK